MGLSGPLSTQSRIYLDANFPMLSTNSKLQNCPKVYSLRRGFGKAFPSFFKRSQKTKAFGVFGCFNGCLVITCRPERWRPLSTFSDVTARDGWTLLTLQHTSAHTHACMRTHTTALQYFMTPGKAAVFPSKG